MNLFDFDYYIPKAQVAQYPLPERDSSRLCVVDRQQKRFEHRRFKEITGYLSEKDVLVLNDTKVIPARIHGRKSSGGKVEIMLLRELRRNEWEAVVKGIHEGFVVIKDGLNARVSPSNGICKVCFEGGDIRGLLKSVGTVPLPPYIKREPQGFDVERYQTVYATHEGAIAAPTAGLHFTSELLCSIIKKGVKVLNLTLHVGYGTFKPVRVMDIEKHQMEAEYYEIPSLTAEEVNLAKSEGRRVIAVGTTVVRALESASTEERKIKAGSGWTSLFIYPGYNFKIVDVIITNLHQPCSTPMMLTSAFTGLDLLKRAYTDCQKRGYRFFSYGDAMLIL